MWRSVSRCRIVVERGARHLRLDAAQHVVGAKFDDDRVGAFRHRPVEPGQPVGRGIAGDAGIGDVDGNALGRQAPPAGAARSRPCRAGRIRRSANCRARRSGSALAARGRLHRCRGRGAPRYKPPHGDLAQTRAATHMSGHASDRAGRGPESTSMNDISGHPFAGDAIALARRQSVARPRRRPRPYPARHRPQYRPRRGGRPARPVGLRQIDAADGDDRTGAAGLRLGRSVAGEDLQQLDEDALARFRGKHIGIVFQAFHLIPTMTALENVAVPLELAGARDALAARRARTGRRRAWRSACIIIRPSFPAASSSASRWPARSRPIPPSSSPTSRPAISTRRPGARSSSFCSAAIASAARRWCWSPTTPRSRRAATACCTCIRAGSTAAARCDAGRRYAECGDCAKGATGAAFRLARIARRLARLRRFHRLHRARRHGDRRRRLGGGEPCRRHRAAPASVILGGDLAFSLIQREASDGRARASSTRTARFPSPPRMRAMARTGDGQIDAGRDQGGRWRLSAVRHGRDRSGHAAAGAVGATRRRVRRRRRSGAADAARSENRRPHHHRQRRDRAARGADQRARQARRRHRPRAARAHQRGGAARHRPVAARQPGALAIPAAAAGRRRERCAP